MIHQYQSGAKLDFMYHLHMILEDLGIWRDKVYRSADRMVAKDRLVRHEVFKMAVLNMVPHLVDVDIVVDVVASSVVVVLCNKQQP